MDRVQQAAPDDRDISPPVDLPLVVDLDGTLVTTDTLFESVLSLVRKDPSCLLSFPGWLSRGRAAFKAEIVTRFRLQEATLPWRADLVEYLRKERSRGRKLILATAANYRIAEQAAACHGLFDEVLASTDTLNLKGTVKRDELVKRFGLRGFDYVGDSHADIPVWAASRIGHVAGPMAALPAAALAAGARQGEVFAGSHPDLRVWVRQLRVYQWVKNVLVFVPALLNHHVDGPILRSLALTFFGFSFIASATYIANDLFDLEADRSHPLKRKRPLASGEISILRAIAISTCLLATGFLLGIADGASLTFSLAAYLLLTGLYSLVLKGKPIVDVVVLAALYTLRVYAGGLVSRAYVSPWLFQFSIFLFLSLAFMKRYSELLKHRRRIQAATSARSYRLRDLHIVSQAGVGSGLVAGMVLALYVNGQEVARLYRRPQALWVVCPLFLYWMIRAWLVTHRGNMQEDPILFAFRDKVSYIVGILIVVAVLVGLMPNGAPIVH